MGVPPIIHFRLGFSTINHPAIGVPPWLRKPPLFLAFYLTFSLAAVEELEESRRVGCTSDKTTRDPTACGKLKHNTKVCFFIYITSGYQLQNCPILSLSYIYTYICTCILVKLNQIKHKQIRGVAAGPKTSNFSGECFKMLKAWNNEDMCCREKMCKLH